MPRRRPADRIEQLADAAVAVFMREGYRRALMADVAQAMGVSQGLLYTYVASKEALFHLAVERVTGAPLDRSLPVPPQPVDETARLLAVTLRRGMAVPELAAALETDAVEDPAAELAGIIRSHYRSVAAHRQALTLLERCAPDLPELRERFFVKGRRPFVARLAELIDRRIAQEAYRPVPDTAVAARLVVETVAWFANHRHGDLDTRLDDDTAEATVVDMLVAALVPGARR